MKTRQSHRQTVKVSHSRWVAYAAASTATAVASSHSAEAAIHYSGRLDVPFPAHTDYARTFPLDQAGDFIYFARLESARFFATNAAYFRAYGIASAAWISAEVILLVWDLTAPEASWIGSDTHAVAITRSGRIAAPAMSVSGSIVVRGSNMGGHEF
jgi:hypothetical protein